jgi:hypothetical protein
MWASWGEIVVVLGVGAMLYVQRTRARTRVYLRDCVRTAGAAGCRKRLHAADRRLLCSATELLRTCAVGSYGPKDLPRVAHAAGRTVGNAVAFLKKVSRPRPSTPESLLRAPARSLAGPTAQARSGVDSFAKEHELLQLHHDVRKSLMELNSIRSEIQQVGPRDPAYAGSRLRCRVVCAACTA